ncbi:MAG: hypothetical protein BroJett025_10930 [Patescibacteria group bacterium]|nr:MAG: hypothetical protein BroJett025_10930 [Patescibacteria group bacterium]
MSLFSFPKVYAQTPEELVGDIAIPKGVDLINQDAGGIGVVLFISNMIRLIIILGGVWALLNIILAAFAYLTGGGKPDTHSKVSSRFTMSVIGLLLMIVSYSIAALIGLLFYGEASYILTPTITPIGG